MKIPTDKAERDQFYCNLIQDCFASRPDRRSKYDVLQNWLLFGNAEQQLPTDYNKLYAHVDALTSFLFSGETTQFVIEIPKKKGIVDYQYEAEKGQLLTKPLNDHWHDSNTDIVFNEALTWALTFDTTFIKFVPMGQRQCMAFMVEPHSMGVLREDIPFLDSQEAVCHEFYMGESHLKRLIKDFPEQRQQEILSLITLEKIEKQEKVLPAGVQTLIINATQPDVVGEVNNYILNYNFNAKIMEKGVVAHELWVFDDDLKDYRSVTVLEGRLVLHDSGKNTFVTGELPFVKLTPNFIYNYFWGRSELMFLIPLQRWINERVPQLKEMMSKQVNPPTWAAGFAGLTDGKLTAMMKAGGVLTDPNPGSQNVGKIETNMPQDIFRELQEIEQMFNEISGIREIMKGGGESGVRAMGHADLLARMGSSRAKKKAYILEDAVEKCAVLLLKFMKKFDDTYYETEKGTTFLAGHLHKDASVKVDAHSSSPVFMETQMEKAQILFEAGAIDEEDLLDALKYPNAEAAKAKLRVRMQQRAQAQAEEAAKEQEGKEK